jgi:hypothetical protein
LLTVSQVVIFSACFLKVYLLTFKQMKAKPLDPLTKSPSLVGCRTHELAPLVELWMRKNPGVNTSHLVRRGLKLALTTYAGKRFSHLVKL